jgi:hypothetical protein
MGKMREGDVGWGGGEGVFDESIVLKKSEVRFRVYI